MTRIAIVEDSQEDAAVLREYLLRYQDTNGVVFCINLFEDPIRFLDPYEGYDIVFMDVKMPHMDGIVAAEKLRRVDTQAVLIYVTNMVQYAVRGYEADALDFVIKPVSYYNFTMKLEKALRICRRRQTEKLHLKSEGTLYILNTADIRYVEITDHDLVFHMENGLLRAKGSLSNIEKQLPVSVFARCNVSYLVNLACVTAVRGDDVIVAGDTLHMTRARKRSFLKQLADYLGG